jgi:hypothetical protein
MILVLINSLLFNGLIMSAPIGAGGRPRSGPERHNLGPDRGRLLADARGLVGPDWGRLGLGPERERLAPGEVPPAAGPA